MSPNTPRTYTSDSSAHTHTGRRRHAAPSDPSWVRRAGLVGGVVGALALCGAAAPAMAQNTAAANTHHHSPARRSGPLALSDAARARQAAGSVDREAIVAALAADRQKAEADAKAAAAAKRAAQREAAHQAGRGQGEGRAGGAGRRAGGAAARTADASPRRPRLLLGPARRDRHPGRDGEHTAAPASSSKVDQLIAFLKSQLGKPYVYGASGPDAYDCSGLTQAAFAAIGVTIPRTSQEQSTVGTPVSISDLQPGDLIFWGGEGSAYHVGVFIGDGQYLDAANPSTPVAIHQLADYMPDWAVDVL